MQKAIANAGQVMWWCDGVFRWAHPMQHVRRRLWLRMQALVTRARP